MLFIDDNELFASREVSGLRVILPSLSDLSAEVSDQKVEIIFIAMPSISKHAHQAVVESNRPYRYSYAVCTSVGSTVEG